VTTHFWRRLDVPGMEIAHIESFEAASGTQLGLAYELRWRLEGDRLELEIVGGARRIVDLAGRDFFDVFASPFFNSLPVVRHGLLESGPPRAYTMAFVNVPSLEVVDSVQRYTPRGDRVVGYSSGTFAADIEFDADGFVTHYHGYLQRLT
jgi:hypothetical protein